MEIFRGNISKLASKLNKIKFFMNHIFYYHIFILFIYLKDLDV